MGAVLKLNPAKGLEGAAAADKDVTGAIEGWLGTIDGDVVAPKEKPLNCFEAAPTAALVILFGLLIDSDVFGIGPDEAEVELKFFEAVLSLCSSSILSLSSLYLESILVNA